MRIHLQPLCVVLALVLILAPLPPGSSPSARAEGSASGHEIAFAAPIDFPTGATPSGDAWNAAAGDQIAIGGTYMPNLVDAVAVADLNRDGNADVAQTNVIANSVSVFRGDGHGRFDEAETYPAGVNPVSVAAGDLNGDGHLDLAVVNNGSGDLTLMMGKGGCTFGPAAPVLLAVASGAGLTLSPRNVVIGNFNGDGVPDLAVSAHVAVPGVAGVVILTANGDGTYTQSLIAIRAPFPGANYVAAGDFNGDGLDDLAVSTGQSASAGDPTPDGTATGDHALIYLNRGGRLGLGAGPAGSDQVIRVGATPREIAVADLNRDSHLDLIVKGSLSHDATVLLGDGQGRFARKQCLPASGHTVAVGDFDSDGVPDLATTNFTESQRMSVLQGDGDGTFQPPIDFWCGEEPTGVAVGDFNGDGRPDAVVASLRTDRLSLLLSAGRQPGDGVRVDWDRYYGSLTSDPTPDPHAPHHTLDVYVPPPGRVPFAGVGQRCPIVFYVHGGRGILSDKIAAGYVMRSLAREGIVGVSVNYRLDGVADAAKRDLAHALRWVYDHAPGYGGDRNNLFVAGHSGVFTPDLITNTGRDWLAEQGLSLSSIRGAVLVSGANPTAQPKAIQPPVLLLSGDQGAEAASPLGLLGGSPGPRATAAAFYASSLAAGVPSSRVHWEIIPGRDHFTLLADMALPEDRGRTLLLDFMRRWLIPGSSG
jgi:hypothetical protein